MKTETETSEKKIYWEKLFFQRYDIKVLSVKDSMS